MRSSAALGVLLALDVLAGGAHADTLVQTCNGCHGPNGVSAAEQMPSIAGLNFRYFYGTMQSFRRDRRAATIMGRIAKGYKSGQLQQMALYFGTQPWAGAHNAAVDPTLAAAGGRLHEEFCEECHEQSGRFQDKKTPPLAGQARGYLLNQMIDYRVAAPGPHQPAMMQERLERLSDADLEALSAFYASRSPGGAE